MYGCTICSGAFIQATQMKDEARKRCCGVQDHCKEKAGEMDSRLKIYSFEEVKARTAEGCCWLILDGASTPSLTTEILSSLREFCHRWLLKA